jgi:hypothetical protein
MILSRNTKLLFFMTTAIKAIKSSFSSNSSNFMDNFEGKRLSNYFLTRPSLSAGIDFNVPFSSNVTEFSFFSVTEVEVFNAVMSLLTLSPAILIYRSENV